MLVAFNVDVDVSFMLNNKSIVHVDSAVHLGHKISKDFDVNNISQKVTNLINNVNMIINSVIVLLL